MLVQAGHSFALSLSDPFTTAYQTYRAALTGASTLPSRWRMCVGWTGSSLGFMLGREFVEARFSPQSRAEAQTMVAAIRCHTHSITRVPQP